MYSFTGPRRPYRVNSESLSILQDSKTLRTMHDKLRSPRGSNQARKLANRFIIGARGRPGGSPSGIHAVVGHKREFAAQR
jgi:hypothetical protein